MAEGTTNNQAQRGTGRRVTVVIGAACAVIVAAPATAIAAAAVFTSSSASTPAVSATNTSGGTGAKAVYGNATATTGTIYGVYGQAASAAGYGVYSAGRLGTTGTLVCTHCVTGTDIAASTFATVPSATNAAKLGGQTPSYFARMVPLSAILKTGVGAAEVADVDGLQVWGECDTGNPQQVFLIIGADSGAGGRVNYFSVDSQGHAVAKGSPVSPATGLLVIAESDGTDQVEGTLIYRLDFNARIITVNFHLYGAGYELSGDALTAG